MFLNMKLFICIPTFNRPTELELLAKTFLIPAIKSNPSLIQVIIADNSDAMIQKRNESIFYQQANVLYIKNPINLGFGGNIIRLAEAVASQNREGYLWYLSDNDAVNSSSFASLIDTITSFGKNSFPDLIALNYRLKLDLINQDKSEILNDRDLISFQELVEHSFPFLPFILLSTFALSTSLIKPVCISELKKNPHDFTQISLCLLSLKSNSSVYRFQPALIHYQPESKGRFRLPSIFDSYVEALVIAETKFRVSRPEYAKKFLRGLLYIVWRMKRGDLELADYPRSFYLLIAKLRHYPTIRGIALALGGFMPTPIIRAFLKMNQNRLASRN